MIRKWVLHILVRLIPSDGPMLEFFPRTAREFAAKFPHEFQGNEVAANGFLCGYMAGSAMPLSCGRRARDRQHIRVVHDRLCRHRVVFRSARKRPPTQT